MAGRLLILVVDDEPIVRESIRDWLQEAGHIVVTAETGEQALEILNHTEIQVIILDIRLPGRTGISILREIHQQKPSIQIIIITAYPSSDLTNEVMKLGAFDYMVKPIIPDDLEKLVNEAVRKIETSKGDGHER